MGKSYLCIVRPHADHTFDVFLKKPKNDGDGYFLPYADFPAGEEPTTGKKLLEKLAMPDYDSDAVFPIKHGFMVVTDHNNDDDSDSPPSADLTPFSFWKLRVDGATE